MAIRVRMGGIYEAANGAILEPIEGFGPDRSGGDMRLLRIQTSRDRHGGYAFTQGMEYWYSIEGRFGGEEHEDSFPGHIVREILP